MQEIITFLKSRRLVNLLMVAANVLVFLILGVKGDMQSPLFMLRHGACAAELVRDGEYYRLFTCMFLHFGIEHLFNNMLILLFLGDTLEKVVGSIRYSVIYLVGGLIGNVVSVLVELHNGSTVVSAGASGAIFAVIGALVFVVVRTKGDVEDLSGRRLILMAGLSILQGFTAQGVDNSAHIGGFVAGFLLAALLGAGSKKKENPRAIV